MGTPRLEELPHSTWDGHRLWEGRWELIHGVPCARTPAPSMKHRSISSRIDRLLQEASDKCRGCRALLPVDGKIDATTEPCEFDLDPCTLSFDFSRIRA